jgi:hypothetical protein
MVVPAMYSVPLTWSDPFIIVKSFGSFSSYSLATAFLNSVLPSNAIGTKDIIIAGLKLVPEKSRLASTIALFSRDSG